MSALHALNGLLVGICNSEVIVKATHTCLMDSSSACVGSGTVESLSYLQWQKAVHAFCRCDIGTSHTSTCNHTLCKGLVSSAFAYSHPPLSFTVVKCQHKHAPRASLYSHICVLGLKRFANVLLAVTFCRLNKSSATTQLHVYFLAQE